MPPREGGPNLRRGVVGRPARGGRLFFGEFLQDSGGDCGKYLHLFNSFDEGLHEIFIQDVGAPLLTFYQKGEVLLLDVE